MQKQTSYNPNIVQADSFLTLHYRLSGPSGDLINTFTGKPATLNVGSEQLSPALEQCLLGLTEGEHQSFDLAVNVAFGKRQEDMQQWLPISLLKEIGDPQEQYAVGEVVKFPTPDGEGSYAGAIVAVEEQRVLFDFNHPLAGKPVTFEVQIIGIL